MAEEIWKPIAGFDPRYEISNKGRVRSKAYRDRMGKQRKESILKSHPNNSGHYQVILYRANGRREYPYVHRLVLEAFVGPHPEGKPCGLHKDDNQSDNRIENLYWGSSSENRYDAVANGVDGNTKKTHCKWGHAFTEENTRITHKGSRSCIACERLHSRGIHPRNKK